MTITAAQLQPLTNSDGIIVLRQEGEGFHVTDSDRFISRFGDAIDLTYASLYNHPNADATWKLHFDALKAAGKIN